MELNDSFLNHNETPDTSQERPNFDWPKLRKAIGFYEREKLRYFPVIWGAKNPAINSWKTFQSRAPTLEEKATWFHEGKPTGIAIVCGAVSGGLVALCFNDPGGAEEFFGPGLWQRLLTSTFVSKTPRGYHVLLRSDTPIKSQFVRKGDNESWLEIRSDGNYIVAPPSLHPIGVLYQAIGVNSIAKPKNLVSFIDQRLAQLGLRVRGTEKAPKERAKLSARERPELSDEFNAAAIQKLLGNCVFIHYCRDKAPTLSEPYWWSMICILVRFGEPGKRTIHELSQPYPEYTEKETDKKIEEALKAGEKEIGPHTCLFIEQDLGFDCPGDCLAKKLSTKSPAGLASRLAVQEQRGAYLYHDKLGWHLNMPKLVNDLLAEYSFKTLRDNEECFVYEEGMYAPLGEATIKEECEKRVPIEFISQHAKNEIIAHIKHQTYVKRTEFNREKWVLNLRNGLYDIRTGKLSPHTPEFLSTIRIPVNYDPSADCPRIKLFFREVLRDEDVLVIEELFGYGLVPDYSIQRAFLFIGDGSNGKSTTLELLKHFLGKDNCANVSLQAIENQRFAVADLFGKLVNIHADIPSTKMPHVGQFKMLTGGDTIGAEKKFKDPFSFVNYARLIFSTNKPPKVDEDTLAFWRRWIMIDFPNKFEGIQADKQILQKLATESELSGLFNVALQGLKRLLSQQGYSYRPSPDEIATRYLKAADPIYAFVEDKCEASSLAWISKDQLYDAFLSYCDEQNIPRIGKESFGRAIKNATNVHVANQRRRIEGEEVYGWRGIQLKEEQEIDMEV